MIKVLSYIIIIVITVVSIYGCVKMYKQSRSLVERTLYILFLIVYFIPIIIYYLDKYDIPTKLGYTNGIDTNRWFDFVSSYIVGIVGAIISGVILVLITLKQIRIQIENNNDDKRIQNAPIFDYVLSNQITVNCKYNHEIKLKEDGDLHHVFFKIENIGLNHGRNINILIKVDDEIDRDFSLNRYQAFIRKEEFVWIDLIFRLDVNNENNRKIVIEVYYDDLISNRYVQKINANFKTIKDNSKSTRFDITNLAIEQEKLEEMVER